MFAQARWNEPIIFERSSKGKVGFSLPSFHEGGSKISSLLQPKVPAELLRSSPPDLPEVSEIEVLRHFTRLSQQNYSVDLGIYPLGSCTMKYNPKVCDAVTSSHKLQDMHPHQDESTAQGVLRILYELSEMLVEIVGVRKVSLAPSAGAQAEFAGALIMRAFHKSRREAEKRDEMIIPDSAHGTNPASAAMAGFKVIELPSNEKGGLNLKALKDVAGERTAGIMVTNPNTLGLFETDILEAAEIIHSAGGLLYYDGANLNAILGKARPGDMGFDIVHINIHKTFATPHGGGGPGAGPLGVTGKLARFLPVPTVEFDGRRYFLDYDRPESIGRLRSFAGNIAVLVRAYTYLLLLGRDGLEEAAEIAVLNANYLARKCSKLEGFNLPYDPSAPRMHECVFSLAELTRETGVSALHVSKRMLDYGIHSPSMYFPLIVGEAMMFEPTETVSKQELDEMVDVLSQIVEESRHNPEVVKNAPHNTTVSKIDEAKASHPRTMTLRWRRTKN